MVILHNRLPPGVSSWRAIAPNGANVRVLTVCAVEGQHRLSDLSVEKSYRVVETAKLFLHLFDPLVVDAPPVAPQPLGDPRAAPAGSRPDQRPVDPEVATHPRQSQPAARVPVGDDRAPLSRRHHSLANASFST